MPYPKREKKEKIIYPHAPWYKTVGGDFSAAFKSMRFSFSRFAVLFAAIFLFETLFVSFLTLSKGSRSVQAEASAELYPYHLDLRDLNDTQCYYIINAERKIPEDDRYFKIVSAEKYAPAGSSFRRYDVQILFTGENMSVRGSYRLFKAAYYSEIESGGDFTEILSPRYQQEGRSIRSLLGTILISGAFIVGMWLLMRLLLSYLSGHFKFTYGIYASCGAGFWRLFGSSAAEICLLCLFAILPAVLTGNLSALLIALAGGGKYVFCFASIPLSFLLTLLPSLFACVQIFRKVSTETPVRLITAADNADLITSPRESAEIEDYFYPRDTTVLTFKRFRKHYFRLFAAVLAFLLVFNALGVYVSYYQKARMQERAQFLLTFENEQTPTEIKLEEEDPDDPDKIIPKKTVLVNTGTGFKAEYEADFYENIAKLTKIRKSAGVFALDLNSHLLVKSESVRKGVGCRVNASETALANCTFESLDETVAKELEGSSAKIEGSLSDVLENDRTIAVSSSVKNGEELSFAVGDRVKIAVSYTEKGKLPSLIATNANKALGQYFEAYDYVYEEFTVGAVLSGITSDETFSVYMNNSLYGHITGSAPVYSDVYLYLENGVSADEKKQIENYLRAFADFDASMSVKDLLAEMNERIEESKSVKQVCVYVSAVLLFALVMIWFLSETLFYLKRKKEFDIWFSLGADLSHLKKMRGIEALTVTLWSDGLYLVFALLLSILLQKFFNTPVGQGLLPLEQAERFPFFIPVLPLLIGLAVNTLCALGSVFSAYAYYFKKAPAIFTGINETPYETEVTEKEESQV